MQENIRQETRQKFDMLLKDALKKKKETSKSKESLISAKSSTVDDNEDEQLTREVSVDVHDNKSYLLDKFLNDAKLHKNDESSADTSTVTVKAPVPKPRRKKKSVASNDTYSVKEQVDNGSDRTYSIEIEPDNNRTMRQLKKRYDSDADINTKSNSSPSRTDSLIVDKIDYENETKKVRSKRSKKKSNAQTRVDEDEPATKYAYEQIMSITIHRTDFLELRSTVLHPMIKIHLVNGKSGEYLKKTDDNRTIIPHYEDKRISYISAVLTQPFDLQKKRMFYPTWEETLTINEDFEYILKEDNDAMLFFELIDFMSFTTACANYSIKEKSNGWYKIAWAFLKLIGKNNVRNVNEKLRLQFYKPHRSVTRSNCNTCEPYVWWKDKKLTKYSSTLFVTIKSVKPQLVMDTFSIRHRRKSRTVNNVDTALSLDNKHDDYTPNDTNIDFDKLMHKRCQLPNTILSKLETYDEGCFIAKFSNSGRYLAYSVLVNSIYTLMVYSLEDLEETCQFPGHQGLIHSIHWSDDDTFIVTASADCSACLWNVKEHAFVQMLPHPSFVYCAIIKSNTVISGCFDQILRIWTCEKDSEYVLRQELQDHKGYITSICSDTKGNLLYSSDSIGNIMQWQNDEEKWFFKRDLIIFEMKGVVINNIKLHKREKRLLVHSRDHNLCLLNLKSGYVIHWLRGNLNNRVQTMSCFSNCGTFVLAGSENNVMNVWNAYSGKLVASYYPYKSYPTTSITIHCIDFHPTENIICVSHYGRKMPILLYKFDKGFKTDDIAVKFYDLDNNNIRLNAKIKENPP